MVSLSFRELCDQGLTQKQKVDIDGENGVQISIVAKSIVTQGWPQTMIMEPKEALSYIYFSFFCYYFHIMLLM